MRLRLNPIAHSAKNGYHAAVESRQGSLLVWLLYACRSLITLGTVDTMRFVKGSFLSTPRFGEKESSAFSPDLTRYPGNLVKVKESIQDTGHLGKVLPHGSWLIRWPLAIPWSNAQPALTRPELVWSATLAVPHSLTLVPYSFTMRVKCV